MVAFLLLSRRDLPLLVLLLVIPKGDLRLPFCPPRKNPPSHFADSSRNHAQAIIAKAGHDTLMLTATQDGELAEWLKAAVC